jgi:hypothetical protein
MVSHLLRFVLPKYSGNVHHCGCCFALLVMSVEFISVVLCWCSGCVFYWPVSMQCIVFLYSFCSCGLTLYGVCGTSMSACVELAQQWQQQRFTLNMTLKYNTIFLCNMLILYIQVCIDGSVLWWSYKSGSLWSPLYSLRADHTENTISSSSSIVACWFVTAEMCSPRCCLAMTASTPSAILAFTHHVTVCFKLSLI